MAGLSAAQALSAHFRDVTVVERDQLGDRPERRPGVPQAQHLHVLLTGGAEALEELVPGYAEGLLAAGAVDVEFPTDMLWLNPMGWVRRYEPSHRLLSASRSLIEWYARQRIAETAGIRIVDRCNAVDIRLSDDRRRVAGVCIARNGGGGAAAVRV
jgi:hypothetical protein